MIRPYLLRWEAIIINKCFFTLMQINDALFPIGGYTHSYGLETYIQQNKVTNKIEAMTYIKANLQTNFLYSELLAAALAYDGASAGDLEEVTKLDEILTATKTPLELRIASNKLATRFIKLVEALEITPLSPVFKLYGQTKHKAHHAVAYGAFVAAAQMDKRLALSFFLYSAASNMVTNCVKTIPLSQTAGQQILYDLQETLEHILNQALVLSIEDLGRGTPGLDIRSMQHEVLYSRIYMS